MPDMPDSMKFKLVKNAKVLVKDRASTSPFEWEIREGIVIDALRDHILVKFHWWIFPYQRWVSLQASPSHEVAYRDEDTRD
jgi:hypothetical protein